MSEEKPQGPMTLGTTVTHYHRWWYRWTLSALFALLLGAAALGAAQKYEWPLEIVLAAIVGACGTLNVIALVMAMRGRNAAAILVANYEARGRLIPDRDGSIPRAKRRVNVVHACGIVATAVGVAALIVGVHGVVVACMCLSLTLWLILAPHLIRERWASFDQVLRQSMENTELYDTNNALQHRLQDLRSYSALLEAEDTSAGFWRTQPTERVRAALMAMFGQDHGVQEILAEALGYPRSSGGPDDPNGGGYVLGEHTSLTLAHEAARVIQAARAQERPRE